MNCKCIFAGAVLLSAAVGAIAPANAATMYSSLSDWQAAVGASTELTSFGVSDGTSGTVFTLVGGPTLTLSSPSLAETIGSGWATWCCGYTGQVLWSNGGQSVTYTFGSPVSAFGIFVEPDLFQTDTISMTLSDGSTLSQTPNGSGGAEFYGYVDPPSITGFTIQDLSSDDFAVGDAFVAATPLPSTWLMLLSGFLGLGLFAYRGSKKSAAALAAA